ncbi:hypothetical protein [Vulcaniibacterium thermophilum]|uniref:Uncharacterized protein n=2 Tax=Vulcaniibacterium thermophilum TaxID=1169913 RepID=A0A918Z1N3_9GAMM|nr:hypothetical protein [Vulcaniibacterium thermophilum]GHE32499.1 hypothetical protein GCM10007167_13080 [Vulcaniibacterium thermophilum]
MAAATGQERARRVRGWGMVLALMAAVAQAQSPMERDDRTVERLRAEGVRHESGQVVLWTLPGEMPAERAQALAQTLDRTAAAVSALLGRRLDTAHYADDRLHVFVASGIGASHVYAGYDHMAHDRPYLFFDLRKVRRGDAPFAHELAHVLVWRFGSHSLREGLATYVELELAARGEASASGLFGMHDADSAESRAAAIARSDAGLRVLPWIGRNGHADAAVTSLEDESSREAYYVLSQSFVRYLVTSLGLATVLDVHADADPEAALRARSGKPLEAWREAWWSALRASRGRPRSRRRVLTRRAGRWASPSAQPNLRIRPRRVGRVLTRRGGVGLRLRLSPTYELDPVA